MRTVDDDSALRVALASALVACRESLADYQAGLLDESELQAALSRTTLVRRGDEAWVLDLTDEHWHRWVRSSESQLLQEVQSCDER